MATRKALVVIDGLLQELPASDSLTGAIPAGGTTGQKLVKNSGADYDGRWADDSATQWGDIGGTLASQTDLVAELDLKADLTALAQVATSGAYGDLSGAPTHLSDFTEDTLHRVVTDDEKTAWNAKQAALVSGTNIKTINSSSILGSGDLVVSGGVDPATKYVIFDHFLNSSNNRDLSQQTGSGGTVSLGTTGYDSKNGILLLSTGVTLSAGCRAGIATGLTTIHLAVTGTKRAMFSMAMNGSVAFDGTLTGTIKCGFTDGFGAELGVDEVIFRQQNAGNMFAVTRSNSTETTTDLGFRMAQDVFKTYDIRVNSDATSVTFYVDGVSVATHTTNIPSGTGRYLGFGANCFRAAATATAVLIAVDWAYMELNYPALWS